MPPGACITATVLPRRRKWSRSGRRPRRRPAPAASRQPTWQEREAEYKKRKAQPRPWSPPQFGGVSPSKSYYSNEVDTDANRCRLARDVLSGAARHSNGKPTDQNDREIAQRDIGSFCS